MRPRDGSGKEIAKTVDSASESSIRRASKAMKKSPVPRPPAVAGVAAGFRHLFPSFGHKKAGGKPPAGLVKSVHAQCFFFFRFFFAPVPS